MASASLFNMDGSELGSVELSDVVFGLRANKPLVHEAAVALRNARRQGNASTKTRGEVSGGGTVFGPHKRSYRQNVPVQVKRRALCCVLSDRVREAQLCVLDALSVAVPKTKPMASLVKRFSPDGKKTLFVTSGVDRNVLLSLRNIPRATVCTAADLNVLDVLDAYRVVVSQDAVAQLEERLS